LARFSTKPLPHRNRFPRGGVTLGFCSALSASRLSPARPSILMQQRSLIHFLSFRLSQVLGRYASGVAVRATQCGFCSATSAVLLTLPCPWSRQCTSSRHVHRSTALMMPCCQ
jgi:hypothetical protein